MLAKILLLRFLAAEFEDTTDTPAAEAPLFGPYTEETAERYDHDAMSMVWISFKTDEYSKIYYDGDAKKDMQETDATSVSSIYGPRMTKLAAEIESAVSKKYHIVFFDSKEYKEHAVEGLNCKVETDTCISVLLPMPMGGEEKEEEEEIVYTRALPDNKNLSESDESQMKFILDFVKLVESDSTEKQQYKFTPSFDDDGADNEEPPEDGFGSDDENPEEV